MVLFFSLEIWFICGDWGGGVYHPFLSLLPTALETIHRPLALPVPLRDLQIFITRLDARRSFAGCCYLFLIFLTFTIQRTTQKKANGYSFNSFSDGPNWTRAFHHTLFLNPSIEKKNKKKPFCALSRAPFLSALFYSVPVLYSPTYPGPLFFSAVCRYKGEESETEKILFGRMIIVIKKLRERWWKSVSPPLFLVWGGILLLLPHRNFLPRGCFQSDGFFVARDSFYGCARGSLKIDLLEKDADLDLDDER